MAYRYEKKQINININITNNLMKSLNQYIIENFDDYLKLSSDAKNKLLELDLMFHVLLNEFKREQVHYMNVVNSKEKVDYILDQVKRGKDFDLKIEYEDSKFQDPKWCDKMVENLNNLVHEFYSIQNCYISKFYLYRLNKTINSILYLKEYCIDNNTFPQNVDKPARYLYDEAVKELKKTKFIDIYELEDDIYKRKFSPEDSQKRLQKVMDKLGYGWEVVVDDNMIPRMSVRPYKELRISSKNKFSEVDLQSLEVHEIGVHTARKYYALQTGLYLFLYGLKGSNKYDEGLAIFNSLNKVKNPKPNILFYICIKVVILYHLYTMSNIDLFMFVKALTNAPDKVIALSILRASRNFSFSLESTGSADVDYFDGYVRIKDMTDQEKERLLKFNIGPDQLYELDTIEKFFKVNKFKPLEYSESGHEEHEDQDIDY